MVYSLRMQEEYETSEYTLSTCLISEIGEKWRRGKVLTQGRTAREVSRTSLSAGKSEYIYSILLL